MIEESIMKKIILLLSILLTFGLLSAKAQLSLGVRFGKVNNGIQFAYVDKTKRTGIQLMAGYSKGKADGWILKPTVVKNFNLGTSHDGWFWVGGLGGHIARYNYEFYKPINHKQGVYIYPNKHTINIGIDAYFGVQYQSDDVPVIFNLGINPWLDIVNRGVEWIDYFNFSVEYRFGKSTLE